MMEKHIIEFFKFLKSKENKKVPFLAKMAHPEIFGKMEKEDLFFKQSLNLDNRTLKELPPGLVIRGNLDLSLTDGLYEIPSDIDLGGGLNLHHSEIKKLPDNLTVGGSLDVSKCKQLIELPNNLEVYEDLILTGSSIGKIGKGLKVGMNLYVGDSPLADKFHYQDEEALLDYIEGEGGTVEGDIKFY